MTEIVLRDWRSSDVAALHAINEAAVPGVNTLTAYAFEDLLASGNDATRVAEINGCIAGFVVLMFEGRDYSSLNYEWISARYPRFGYIDRVAVSTDARGSGIGTAIYEDAFRWLGAKRDVLLAEVNLSPPNPGSLRFHKRLGFREVGERWSGDGGKGVVYLERRLPP